MLCISPECSNLHFSPYLQTPFINKRHCSFTAALPMSAKKMLAGAWRKTTPIVQTSTADKPSATDADGRTARAGLWVVGEAASTGVHGANRLASNSLLEAVVFTHQAAQSCQEWLREAQSACHLKTYKWASAKAERRAAKVEKEASKVEMERGPLEKEEDQKDAKADFPPKPFGRR